MRAYIVIPEGTSLVLTNASTPHYAASKARRGKGQVVAVAEAMVLPSSSAMPVTTEGPAVIAGQLAWADDGSTVERA